jgi:hypothetical protein
MLEYCCFLMLVKIVQFWRALPLTHTKMLDPARVLAPPHPWPDGCLDTFLQIIVPLHYVWNFGHEIYHVTE